MNGRAACIAAEVGGCATGVNGCAVNTGRPARTRNVPNGCAVNISHANSANTNKAFSQMRPHHATVTHSLQRTERGASIQHRMHSLQRDKTHIKLAGTERGESIQHRIRAELRAHGLKLMQLFREWDCDASNSISREEFQLALRALKIKGGVEDFDSLFDAWDVDSSGQLAYTEVLAALSGRRYDAFDAFDEDLGNQQSRIQALASAAYVEEAAKEAARARELTRQEAAQQRAWALSKWRTAQHGLSAALWLQRQVASTGASTRSAQPGVPSLSRGAAAASPASSAGVPSMRGLALAVRAFSESLSEEAAQTSGSEIADAGDVTEAVRVICACPHVHGVHMCMVSHMHGVHMYDGVCMMVSHMHGTSHSVLAHTQQSTWPHGCIGCTCIRHVRGEPSQPSMHAPRACMHLDPPTTHPHAHPCALVHTAPTSACARIAHAPPSRTDAHPDSESRGVTESVRPDDSHVRSLAARGGHIHAHTHAHTHAFARW